MGDPYKDVCEEGARQAHEDLRRDRRKLRTKVCELSTRLKIARRATAAAEDNAISLMVRAEKAEATLEKAESDIANAIRDLRKHHGYSGAVQALANDLDIRATRRAVMRADGSEGDE